jgi:DNA adenine methylase
MGGKRRLADRIIATFPDHTCYVEPFGAEEYVRLAETMRGIKGRAILSTNDSADVRRILRGFKREAVELAYTVGGGRKMARELIVRSW